jgi:hypothetical protein
MSCELYWREGILRVERGEPDPHRDSCAECQREHLAREEIIHALPLVAAGELGDPSWEALVWARIARQERVKPRVVWFWASMAATACVLILASWMILRDREADQLLAEDAPMIEVMQGPMAMRSLRSSRSPSEMNVGDQLRITAKRGDEVRVYHNNDLVFACPAGTTSGGCVSDDHGLIAEAKLSMPGQYALVLITPPDRSRRRAMPPPVGGLAKDLTALTDAGCNYQLNQISVP